MIGFAFAPILTRIYSPEDFSNLAIYVSIIAILTVFATGKYENAIILSKKEEEAYQLIVLATILTIIISFLYLVIILLFEDFLVDFFHISTIRTWLLFIPITILARSGYRILEIWFNRKKEYYLMSGNRTLAAGINGSLKVGFQLVFSLNAFGLVLSQALSQIISTFLFGRDFFKKNKVNLTIKLQDLKEVAVTYRSFPLYSMPAAFFSIFSKELPIFLLVAYFEPTIVGFYALTKMFLEVPVSVVANSFLEVFKQKATEDFYQFGNCRAIYLNTLKKLLLIATLPFLALYFLAPSLFPLIFGEKWAIAGEIAQVFTLLYFVKFITTPLAFVFYIRDKINWELFFQIAVFIITLSSFFFGSTYFNNPMDTLSLFVWGYVLVYLFYLFFSYKLAIAK